MRLMKQRTGVTRHRLWAGHLHRRGDYLTVKLLIHSVSLWGHGNIRTWEPADPGHFAELVFVDIGQKGKKGSDTFTIRVATPSGLDALDDKNGILAIRPLLIMRRYHFDDLWRWLESTVRDCEEETWLACVDNLRRHFNWEY